MADHEEPLERPQLVPPAPSAPPAAPAPAAPRSIYDLVADHVATEHQGEPTVRELLREAGIDHSVIADPHGDPRAPVPPLVRIEHVSAASLFARFRAQGLTAETRIPKDVFDQALHEAQHGRI
jgi:hypothetical protein